MISPAFLRACRRVTTAVVGLGLATSVIAAAAPFTEGLCVPRTSTPPTIDGKLGDAEWAESAKLDGHIIYFAIVGGKNVDPRASRTLVSYDEQNLYLAVSSELPPDGKLVADTKNMGDSSAVLDDSIEVWIDALRSERAKGTPKLPFCQFIGNSLDVYFEQQFVPGSVANGSWRGNWQYKNGINRERNRWEMEMSVAWHDLGVPAGTTMSGQEIGILVSRNWQRPRSQAPWFLCQGFDHTQSYPVLKLGPSGTPFTLALGELYQGKFAPTVTVTNRSAQAVEYTFSVDVKHSDMPDQMFTQTQRVAPQETALLKLQDQGDGFHPNAEHTAEFKLTADGQELLKRTLIWKFPAMSPFPWKVAALTPDAGLRLAYYPSLNRLCLQLDSELILTDAQQVETLRATVMDAAGTVILTKELPVQKKMAEFALELPTLEDGIYTVKGEAMVAGKIIKTINKTFERQHFPWEGNRLGLTDQVYPPFTPIRVQENQLSVVLRDYRLNALGLPSGIVTQGRELLAQGGMELGFLSSDGKPGTWVEQTGALMRQTDTEARYVGRAQSQELTVTLRSRIEYDGCAKVEMELAPTAGTVELQEFYLDIPVREEMATLFHAAQASLRSNPAGALPSGSGIIWDSTKTGNGPLLGTFLPYLWLGCGAEGIAWFADNDRGWAVDDQKPCLTIRRENGKVTLRVQFINRPTVLDAPRQIVFGWQASPTKPMPKDWRKPQTEIPMHGGSNRYWGIRSAFAGKYPDGRDYRFADQLLIARQRGRPNYAFLEEWFATHYGDVTDAALIDSIKAHIGGGTNWVIGAGRAGNPVMLYFEEHFQDQTSPEWQIFQDEWGWNAFTDRQWLKKIMSNDDSASGIPINPTRSYQDFAMWEASEWLRRGLGLYCDNNFLRQSNNTVITAAYQRADGAVQPSAGLWDMREYHQRMWVLAQQCQPFTPYRLLISLHMTNTQLIPINTWADVNLDIEWWWDGGNKPFPADLLLTESAGLQTGSYPHALGLVTAKNSYATDQKDATGAMIPNPEALRHEWGVRMVHEILQSLHGVDAKQYPLEKIVRDFGYGEPDCQVYNYWAAESPLSISSPEVKSIVLERNGQLLVVLTSWADVPTTVKLTLGEAFRQYQKHAVYDAESDQPLARESGDTQVILPKYGVAVLRLTPKTKKTE